MQMILNRDAVVIAQVFMEEKQGKVFFTAMAEVSGRGTAIEMRSFPTGQEAMDWLAERLTLKADTPT